MAFSRSYKLSVQPDNRLLGYGSLASEFRKCFCQPRLLAELAGRSGIFSGERLRTHASLFSFGSQRALIQVRVFDPVRIRVGWGHLTVMMDPVKL